MSLTNLSELMESDEEVRKFVLESTRIFAPHILYHLLKDGTADKDRLDDRNYLFSILRANTSIVSRIEVVAPIDNEFLDAARDAVDSGRQLVAVVLVATSIEHRINHYLRDELEIIRGLSRPDVTEAIKSNITTKLGWLLSLTSGVRLSDDILRRVKQIMEWRNSIVHYKLIPNRAEDDPPYERLLQEIENYGTEKLLSTPDALDRELLENASAVDPLLVLAYEVTDRHFGTATEG